MSAVIHYTDAICSFASVDDVTLSLWRGPATKERVFAQRSVLESVTRRHSKIYSLTGFRTVDMGFKMMPNDEVRPEFERLVQIVDGKLVAHAFIIEGDGFMASLVRSSATSLATMFRKGRTINRTFSEPYAGGEWLATAREGGAMLGQGAMLVSTLRVMNARLDENNAPAKSGAASLR